MIDKANLSADQYSAKYDWQKTLLTGTMLDGTSLGQTDMGAVTDVTGVGKKNTTLLGQ